MHHHYRSLGGWSFALQDYWYENITKYVDDSNFQKMADIIDPLGKLKAYALFNSLRTLGQYRNIGKKFSCNNHRLITGYFLLGVNCVKIIRLVGQLRPFS